MTTTSATTLTSPTMSWEMFVMIVVWFFGAILFVVTSWHWERPSRAKTWERICRRQFLSDKLSRISKLFVYTPRIAPIGGMIIEVEYTL